MAAKTFFEDYLQAIASKFSRQSTSEMGYRTDLEILLKKIFESIKVHQIDHDPKATQHNKPDFVILSHDIPILYLEAKDIGVSLDKIEKSEQMTRYYGYANLVLTDYLEFRFYRNGIKYGEPIKIADFNLKNRTLDTRPENFENLAKTLLDFTKSHKEPIKSGQHLAKIMGGKAQRIRDNIRQYFSLESGLDSDLNKLFKTLKEVLVHDLNPESFADMYAQTLVYGLFVARYNDTSLGSFSRREARELIPNSNPFLRNFFDHIVGIHFDNRLKYIVDELCEVFSHADVNQLMQQYFKTDLWGETHEQKDPVIHFYEDFLNEYDAGMRKKMGAYYTPPAVVNFIVRSVDYLLQKEFNLTGGLADTAKTKDDLHKVQILDPACGTGTFISAAIRIIYERLLKTGQKGTWTTYVHNELLSRIFGFELMMTPYTIAHLKLGIAFRKTGFWDFHKRLGIFLTNSLEQNVKQPTLFGVGLSEIITKESVEATQIKNEKPIMVVMGNPPYSVSSSNKGEWIQNLIKVYKQNLNERKINLDDDYIKFIRFAEHFIEKNGTGIVAMITNNSFIDGITHRQMRKHLLETFDEIYILDLHGSSKKKETAPDGGDDKNVFDIQQGVSISLFVRKNPEKKKLGDVYHSEIFGKRKVKFNLLNSNTIKTIKWQKLNYSAPNYFFVPKDFSVLKKYEQCFKLDELFLINNSGIQTDRDLLFVDFEEKALSERIQKLILGNYDAYFKGRYKIFDSSSYKLSERIKNKKFNTKFLLKQQYRLFDYRWIYYDPTIISRPGYNLYKNLLFDANLALLISKQQSSSDFKHVFLTKELVDRCTVSLQTKEGAYTFPLYLYSEDGTKIPNLKTEIVSQVEKIVGKTTPEDILDYIYAVLHSPKYREKYKEFLKIDFPRVPYPKDKNIFKKLVKFGTELRQLHLLEAPEVNKFITSYPVDGSNIVEKIAHQDGKVFINKDQYFGQVPETAWNFYIGGYQPAQKWLKDRKGRELNNEDIEHYQKMIVALAETAKIMKEIARII